MTWKPPARSALVASSLLLLTGSPRLGAGPLDPPAPLQNVRVNDPSRDEVGRTNSRSSVTVRGDRIVVAFNDAAENPAGYAVSTDGGATFSHRRVPPPSDGHNAGGPVVAGGPDGEVYCATLTGVAGGDLSSVGVARSTDGGLTFASPVDVARPIADLYDLQDRPWVGVDTWSGSPRRGHVYVTWTDFLSTGEIAIVLSRSTDGGASYSYPRAVSRLDTAGVQGSAIATAPNGDLYIGWEDGHVSPAGIAVARSTDGGLTFVSGKIVATINPLRVLTGGGGVRANSHPSLAVDGAGVLHVTWAAVSSGATADRADVFYSRSTDAGSTFSAPRKLNDDGTSTTQAFPSIAATADGHVAVRYLDRRDDPVNDSLSDVSVVISRDGGVTWGRSRRVTDQSFSFGPVESTAGAGYHGGHDAIAADAGRFWVTWSDERGSDPDVYLAFLPLDADAPAAGFGVSSRQVQALVKAGETVGLDVVTSATGGFSGSLDLSASALSVSSGSPYPGLSLSFASPSVVAGQSTRLTVAAPPDTPPGSYVVRVAASSGSSTRATTVRLTVLERARALGVPANVTSTAGFTGGGVLEADASGTLHLVYEDDTAAVLGEDVYTRRSTDGGRTFTAPLKLNASRAIGVEPVLATGPSSRVHVAWAGQGSDGGNARVWITRSTDGGATFSSPSAVSGSDQWARHPAIAVNGAGNVMLAWYDVSSSPPSIRYARSSEGVTFGSVARVDEGAASAISRPGLAFDSKGAAYLVYTQQAFTLAGAISQVGLAIARDGRTFGEPVDVTDYRVVNAFGPDVAVGPGDVLALAYYNRHVDAVSRPSGENMRFFRTAAGTVNREVVLRRSTDGGATFGAESAVSRNAGQSYFPAVAVDSDGSILVAWEDTGDGAASDILLSRSSDGGQTFPAPLNVSATPGLSGSLANPLDQAGGSGKTTIALAGGTAFVSWLDDSPTNPDVFLLGVPRAALANRPPQVSVPGPASDVTVEAGVDVTFAGAASDPDGDALTIAWSFGDGTTSAVASPGAHPFALPGTYTVTLKATDVWGASASATRVVNVTSPAAPAASVTLLLPVVLESAGLLGSRYSSEVTLVSRAPSPVGVRLRYTSSVGAGSGWARLALAPGEMRTLPGVIGFLRGRNLAIPADGSSQVGTLLVAFDGVTDPRAVHALVRTDTPDPSGGGGTFGLFYGPARTFTDRLLLPGLQQNASQRSNVALVNAGGEAVSLRVELLGPSGEPLGTPVDVGLPPYGWRQLDQPLSGLAASGRAVVARTAGSSPFSAYAVLNDEVTSDGSYVPPGDVAGPPGSGLLSLVPVVVDVSGAARFKTELTLTNLTGSTLALRLGYTPAAGFGGGAGSVGLSLGPGEQRILPDAIAFLRETLPIEADGRSVAGSVLVNAPTGAPPRAFAVGARTYVPLSPRGSYGLFYPGVSPEEAAEDEAYVYGLFEDASRRSNLALVAFDGPGDELRLSVQLFAADGAPAGEPIEVTLAGGGWRQLNRPLLAAGVQAGYARIRRISGSSRFFAYGAVNDNVTSDGGYVPFVR